MNYVRKKKKEMKVDDLTVILWEKNQFSMEVRKVT